MKELFKKYLQTYIQLLTKGSTEFFIAIVDIEKNLGETFLGQCSEKQEYKTAWFDRKDYAEAVVLRNDRSVSKLVLLSDESVKMIDSLKDFVEYPALPEDKEILWECLTAAFGVPLEEENKKIVETVLDNQRITVEELLEYLHVCLNKTGFDTEKIKKNLYRLYIWTTNIDKPTKQYLRKMIRHSDPFVIENKLIKGITDGLTTVTSEETTDILNALSVNNFQKIYQNIRYERVEGAFKSAKQKPAGASF